MNAGRIKTGAEYVGGVVIATFFVALLSYIFSFLGTIFCAALGGMMLGALPTRRWQAIPISFIFPLIIFGLLRGMKAELAGSQMVVVTVASYSAFWLAYVVARALFFLERPKAAPAGGESQPSAPAGAAEAVGPSPLPAALATAQDGNASAPFSLEMLEGDWSRDMNAQALCERRRLSFEQEKLTLSIIDATDHVQVLARATVKLCTAGSTPALLISNREVQQGAGQVN